MRDTWHDINMCLFFFQTSDQINLEQEPEQEQGVSITLPTLAWCMRDEQVAKSERKTVGGAHYMLYEAIWFCVQWNHTKESSQ